MKRAAWSVVNDCLVSAVPQEFNHSRFFFDLKVKRDTLLASSFVNVLHEATSMRSGSVVSDSAQTGSPKDQLVFCPDSRT